MNNTTTINCTSGGVHNCTLISISTRKTHYNKTDASRLLEITQTINTFLCCLVVLIGIIGNLLTFCVFKLKHSNTSKTKRGSTSVAGRFSTTTATSTTKTTSLSSSQSYILALAFSDLLFLVSHSLEDILPNLASIFHITDNSVLNITDRYSLICKITLYIRNASRVSSSYLIVFFALERLMVVSKPLKRLKFHYKRFNRNLSIFVFLFSLIVTSYTPIISGLRQLEEHEEDSVKHICDTLNKYKHVYDYITIAYVCVQMLLPIVAICYLNFYIVKVLMTRKNCVVRRYFKTTKSPTSSSQDSTFDHSSSIEIGKQQQQQQQRNNSIIIADATATLYPFTPITPANSIVQISNLMPVTTNSNIIQNLNNAALMCSTLKKSRKSKSHSIDLTASNNLAATNNKTQQQQQLNEQYFYTIRKLANNSKPSTGGGATSFDLVNLYPSYHEYTTTTTAQNNRLRLVPSVSSTGSAAATARRRSSLISTSLNTNLELDQSNYFHTHTQDNSCWIFRHSRLLFKLKEAGRATFILILISVSFLVLNIPYLIAWLCFFVPLKYNLITSVESKQKRFAFVYITEIFHILNYSVNFFLYCFSSKIFRQELKQFLKPCCCCCCCCSNEKRCNTKKLVVSASSPNIQSNRIHQQQQQRYNIRYGSISSTSGFLTGSVRSGNHRRSFSNNNNRTTTNCDDR